MTELRYTLSLIIPCYNEERTIETCIRRVYALNEGQPFTLEIIVVDDASTDGSIQVIEKLAAQYQEIQILKHSKNRGKGAALKTGLLHATGEYVGIQDADAEYDPKDYFALLEPLLADKADVVYGSRYLKPDTRRVLYFWHTWMNRSLTTVSNMFTNLDITDMETCYKLFRREVIQKIAPELKEERFGFEPEVTTKVAQSNYRVYECAISYNPRSYEEGKKIGWKDGVHALYCILHYGAHAAPLPMQIMLYFFIGAISALANLLCFYAALRFGLAVSWAIGSAFCIAALVNYLLCIAILFQHKARWNTAGEVFLYLISILFMGGLDYGLTRGLISLGWNPLGAKFLASIMGFIGNFLLRKWLVFSEKKKDVTIQSPAGDSVEPPVQALENKKSSEITLRLNSYKKTAKGVLPMNRQKSYPSIETMKSFIKKYAPLISMALLSTVILAGIVVRIIMYVKVRSLWGDEAALAESIVTRDFGALIATPLANTQTAPVLYLYTIKIFGLLFGYTEGPLRFFSFIMFAGLLLTLFLLLTKAYKINRSIALFALALTATFPLYMHYSNELKPYMGDAFFVILVLFTYHCYTRGRIKLSVLTGMYGITLLLSSPALFFIASVFMVEFFTAAIEKDGKRVLHTMMAGLAVLACFIGYYLFWLRPVATNDYMVDFWKDRRFYLFPASKEVINNNLRMLYSMAGIRNCLYLPFAVVGFLYLILKKDKISCVVGCSALLLLIASSLGKYPMAGRLYLFFPVLNIMYMSVCFAVLKTLGINDIKIPVKQCFPVLAAVFIALNMGFIKFAGDGIYLKTQEANPLIEYARNNINEDEYLYSYIGATSVLKFKNGYETARIGNVSRDNIIYGKQIWKDLLSDQVPDSFYEDLNKIVRAKKVYLLFYHHNPERTENFINQLKARGNLEEVLNVHDTLLYYFTAE